MTDVQNDWRPGEWGVGVVTLDHHLDDQIYRVVVVCQPASATWEEQRDLAGELQAGCERLGFKEVFWVTPEGLMFFIEPHDEKDLPGIGEAAASMLPPIRFDQSALLDEPVERRRRQGRYEPRPVDCLPLYWWWLADSASGKIVLGPEPDSHPAYRESCFEARERLHVPEADVGYIYPRAASEEFPQGSYRITNADHEAVEDESLAIRVRDALKRRESELIEAGVQAHRGWTPSS